MGLFDLFKLQLCRLAVARQGAFLGSRVTFAAQKPGFERSRWQCYPLTLADVGEVLPGEVAPHEQAK